MHDGKLRSRYELSIRELNRTLIQQAPVREEVDANGRTWRIVSLPAQAVYAGDGDET